MSVKENPEVPFHVYFADKDWLDHKMALEEIKKHDLNVKFRYIPSSHQVCLVLRLFKELQYLRLLKSKL